MESEEFEQNDGSSEVHEVANQNPNSQNKMEPDKGQTYKRTTPSHQRDPDVGHLETVPCSRPIQSDQTEAIVSQLGTVSLKQDTTQTHDTAVAMRPGRQHYCT